MNIGLRSNFVPQTRFVATAAISLVSRVLLVFGDFIPLDVQHPSVVIFASNRVIFIVLAHCVLEVVVDFAVRLLRGKRPTQVVLEISLRQPSVFFASNQVISIKLVRGNKEKNPCRICNFSHPPDQCPFYKVTTKESTACALAPPSVRSEVACSLQESFSGKLHLQFGTVN